MNAVILAAGRGSRLGPLTSTSPKCLVPLAGHPLLEWQLDALRAAGVGEIAIVGGYCADRMDGAGDRIIHNPRWAETNMVASLLCAAPLMRSAPILVSYSDIVYHPSIITALSDSTADLAIAYDARWQSLWAERFEDPLSDAENFLLRNGRLDGIGGRADSLEAIQGQYMGLLKFTPRGWAVVDEYLAGLSQVEVDRLDMTGLLGLLIASGVEIEAVEIRGRWCEVDSASDLQLYEQRASDSNGSWTHDWRWEE